MKPQPSQITVPTTPDIHHIVRSAAKYHTIDRYGTRFTRQMRKVQAGICDGLDELHAFTDRSGSFIAVSPCFRSLSVTNQKAKGFIWEFGPSKRVSVGPQPRPGPGCAIG